MLANDPCRCESLRESDLAAAHCLLPVDAQHLRFLEVDVPPPFLQNDASGGGGASDSASAVTVRTLTITFPETATAEHAAAPLAFTAGVLTELTSNARTAAAELRHLRIEDKVDEGAVSQVVGDGDFGLISTLHASLRTISESASVDASRVGRLHTIAVLARFGCVLCTCVAVSIALAHSVSVSVCAACVFVYCICARVIACADRVAGAAVSAEPKSGSRSSSTCC
jgi:hypothetical protein